MKSKSKKKPILPVDIALPERELLEDGVMFVRLKTLDELDTFWRGHKDQFDLACEGGFSDEPIFFEGI